MGRYILQRILAFVIILYIVATLTFFLMHAIPGGPWDALALQDKAKWIPEGIVAQLNERYGLDKPLWEQYVSFLSGAIRFDFGYSFYNATRTVVELYKELFPYSVHLGLLTMAFSTVVGVGFGILAAIKQGTWVDNLSTVLALFSMVVPAFVFAVLLQYVVGVRLGWLPTGGWNGPKYWILPVVANSMGPIGILQRYTRSSMVEVMRANYVRTARAKGMRERTVMLVHVFKNALTPVITVGGPMAANMMTGSLFVEGMFRVPGIGMYSLTAIGNRDYPMIMANTLVFSTIITLAYLGTDLVYALIDPRVSYSKGK